jgi:hypothetical protein
MPIDGGMGCCWAGKEMIVKLPMPKSRILQWICTGLAWVYAGGYSVYLFNSAVIAWPGMTFLDWCIYVSYESVYAMFWPVLVLLPLTGFHW